MDVPSTVSVIIGVVSVVVAVFAMRQASGAARESRENFEKTRDLLAEIDKRAAVIEQVVAESQRELLDTVKKLAIPEKPDANEQLGLEIIKSMMQNPSGMREVFEQFASFGILEDSGKAAGQQFQPNRQGRS